MIQLTTINSGNLNSVGYDVKNKILEIQFDNNTIYHYLQVPQKIYVELMKAESPSIYFYAAIRNRFQYRQIQYKTNYNGNTTIAITKKTDNDDDNDYEEDEIDFHDDMYGIEVDDGIWVDFSDD